MKSTDSDHVEVVVIEAKKGEETKTEGDPEIRLNGCVQWISKGINEVHTNDSKDGEKMILGKIKL